VSAFPDFVSSGGAIGGAGTYNEDESCSSFSTSASRIEGPDLCDLSKVKYGRGSTPGSNFGRRLDKI